MEEVAVVATIFMQRAWPFYIDRSSLNISTKMFPVYIELSAYCNISSPVFLRLQRGVMLVAYKLLYIWVSVGERFVMDGFEKIACDVCDAWIFLAALL